MQVLLTTSGIGSRLGELTKFTNKGLATVGGNAALGRIVECYNEDTEFIVTVGHFADHVQDFLTLAFPNHKFTFVPVRPYYGQGSSLVCSMLHAAPFIKGPFVFHVSDAIILDTRIPELDCNWLGGAKGGDSSKYATLMWDGELVTNVLPKGELNFDFSYIGVAGIWDWEPYLEALREVYDSNPGGDETLSDTHVLRLLVSRKTLDFRVREFRGSESQIPTWLDIGNSESLREAQRFFPVNSHSLSKPSEATYFLRDRSVVKFFSDAAVASRRAERSKLIRGRIPKMQGYRGNFYKYQYELGTPASEVPRDQLITRLLHDAVRNFWQEEGGVDSSDWEETCHKFYVDKTLGRVRAYEKRSGRKDHKLLINDNVVPSVVEMLEQIPPHILVGTPCMFHGDFILENILTNNGGFIYLDWRDEFAGKPYGDMFYDLAKLNHNLIFNHQVVNEHGFRVAVSPVSVTVELLVKFNALRAQKVLHTFVLDTYPEKDPIRRINILTALIWINMAPLHEHPLDDFLFYFGKWNLYKELVNAI